MSFWNSVLVPDIKRLIGGYNLISRETVIAHKKSLLIHIPNFALFRNGLHNHSLRECLVLFNATPSLSSPYFSSF